MRRSLNPILGLFLLFFVVGCKGTEPIPIEIGDTAPAFSLPAVGRTSGKVTSDQLQGKITVLNFWSTSCSVCLKETVDLGEIYKSGKANVIGIVLEEDSDYVGKFVKDRGIEYPIAMGDESVFTRFDGYAIPYTLILDRSRAIRKRVYGRIEASELAKAIDEIDRYPVALGSALAGKIVQQ